ncbi:hypothetical protein SZ25_00833 [Candidatus Arcanobacter lacustris]|jgi:prepilin-type N-terminal cleavage/methylation domain-containing protein|uniref:Type II secretion system protein G n=1 Tax=Candidatus Arcanibacter lacustris TaxID=1607817 RepID=A0A0F5MMZ6_9RICK|nr:hypothetical protein SZ25_00833 [Candidatus Arcanobacter lacustris]
MKKQGFSLLEISVVLSIIALLVSAIAVSKNMLANARARTVVSEIGSFNTAIIAFQNIYNYLPGDFPGAYVVWGSSCNATAANCNGNGDGIITQTDGTVATTNEGVKFWQHLYLAGLLVGYNSGYGSGYMAIGTNIPASNYNNIMGYFAQTNYLLLAALGGSGNTTSPYQYYDYGVVNNMDLFNIDSKIDDGIASTGIFQTNAAINPLNNTITSGKCPYGATNGYDLANANQRYCRGIYYW